MFILHTQVRVATGWIQPNSYELVLSFYVCKTEAQTPPWQVFHALAPNPLIMQKQMPKPAW